MSNQSNFNGGGSAPPEYAGIAGDQIPVGDALAKLVEQEKARHAAAFEANREAVRAQELRAPLPQTRSVVMRGPSEAIRSLQSSGLVGPDGTITPEGRAAGITDELVAEAAKRSDEVPGERSKESPAKGDESASREATLVDADVAIAQAFEQHGNEAGALYIESLIDDPNGSLFEDDAAGAAFEAAGVARLQAMAKQVGFVDSERNLKLLNTKVRSDARFSDAVKSAAMGHWDGFKTILDDLYSEVAAGR